MTKPTEAQRRDTVADIMAWEDGQMDPDEELAFFEELVKSGLVYQLQGMYGRRAHDLGLI